MAAGLVDTGAADVWADGGPRSMVAAMGGTAAWWNGVDPGMLSNIDGQIHPGALKYYDEIGAPVADANR